MVKILIEERGKEMSTVHIYILFLVTDLIGSFPVYNIGHPFFGWAIFVCTLSLIMFEGFACAPLDAASWYETSWRYKKLVWFREYIVNCLTIIMLVRNFAYIMMVISSLSVVSGVLLCISRARVTNLASSLRLEIEVFMFFIQRYVSQQLSWKENV